jgi:hypothetical protein
MFTKIQTFNRKAKVTAAAFKKLIPEWLPQKILEKMHPVHLTGKTDQDIIMIITNARHTAELWEAAVQNLCL